VTGAIDSASMIEAAHRAADAGDFPAAERLLREAATIQEATLGSLHPDLASTLNNLAFVCERTNNIAEAERGYRRAHAIAVASLGPRDPFVATSIKNLVGFCAAHGIPIWKPPSVQPEPDDAAPDIESPPEVALEQVPVVAQQTRRTPLALGVTALAGVIVLSIVFTTMRSEQTSSSGAPVPSISTAPVSPPVTPTPAPAPSVPAREAQPPVVAAPKPESGIAVAPQPVTVLNAQLCTALARRGSPDWQCTPADGDLRPGTFFFYTRLLSGASTTVEHRWYWDGRMHQAMKLRIAANPGSGYRTFSSNTVSVERAGEWRVELRAADGTVLQDRRFVIQAP
jgi:hypothetical protein